MTTLAANNAEVFTKLKSHIDTIATKNSELSDKFLTDIKLSVNNHYSVEGDKSKTHYETVQANLQKVLTTIAEDSKKINDMKESLEIKQQIEEFKENISKLNEFLTKMSSLFK